MTATCRVCGRDFTAGSNRAAYCSEECKGRARAARPPRVRQYGERTFGERVCEGCGEQFVAKHAAARFCGVRCKSDAQRVAPRVGSREEWRARAYGDRVCVNCGDPYVPTYEGQRFCGRSCAYAHRKVETAAKRVPCPVCGEPMDPRRGACSVECSAVQRRSAVTERTCERCGERFAARRTTRGQRFCSRTCSARSRKGSAPVGARRVTAAGYAEVKIAPGGWRPEHRVVMERVLGRSLIAGENVHHVNGVRDDNRESNLELWLTAQPRGHRVEDAVAFAVEVLARYAPERLAAV